MSLHDEMTLKYNLQACAHMLKEAGWTIACSMMHSGGATGNFGVCWVKDGRRFWLNRNTVGAFDAHCHAHEFQPTPPFIVEGVDTEDGSRCTLFESNSSSEAIRWMRGYVRGAGDAGGWNLIEVYDLRCEDAERLAFWERDED